MRQGWTLALIIALTVSVAALSWRLGYHSGADASGSQGGSDTVTVVNVIRDTTTVVLPVPVLVTVIDSILIPYPDLVIIHDTTFVKLPRESKEYSGKDFRAVVSGFQPSLDMFQVFPETRTVTRTISAPSRKSPRWSVGVQAGYGVTLRDRRIAPAPYIGLGVSYSLFQVPKK